MFLSIYSRKISIEIICINTNAAVTPSPMTAKETYVLKNKYAIVILTSVVLLAAIAALWALNGAGLTGGVERSKTITFVVDGQEVANIDREFLLARESRTFPATIRSSGRMPQRVQYTGILLANLFKQLDIDISNSRQIVVKAIDGYVSTLTVEELQRGRVYIAFQMDGEDLKPRNEGGNGPYQLVILNDPYSQRWCKYVYQVELK